MTAPADPASDAAGGAPRPDLTATLADVADVEGWLTNGQARLLWESAARVVPGGRIVEIGSFRGRSTVVLGRSADRSIELVAIDPHAGNDRGPQEIDGFADEAALDHEVFVGNLERAGVRDRVTHVRAFSDAAHGRVDDPIDLLYIDGAHRYAPARADIRDWGARVTEGGTMLIHDSFSSVGVTLAIGHELFGGSRWRYVGRSGSMTEYRRERLSPKARVANAVHQALELPWFARNVLIKALITARLGRLTKLFGHDPSVWPY
ncbi:class I SAM-dependent methyltransferase [Iamia sp.]|uniref:class I SAM-dependent methyltransferase n=1 Tax=Iamia sp. TaxID=2722710 RepID=UPI002CE2C6E8|nr:class I SAM-dependent methyltransferase [Iamia sp.]HXH55689.1 class I SAM-dependent methyltransferase [Iamia sp.]